MSYGGWKWYVTDTQNYFSPVSSEIHQGRKNTRGALTLAAIETLQYINLRKAAWIADVFEEHKTLRNSGDDKSFWHAYCQKLKKVRRNFDLW